MFIGLSIQEPEERQREENKRGNKESIDSVSGEAANHSGTQTAPKIMCFADLLASSDCSVELLRVGLSQNWTTSRKTTVAAILFDRLCGFDTCPALECFTFSKRRGEWTPGALLGGNLQHFDDKLHRE